MSVESQTVLSEVTVAVILVALITFFPLAGCGPRADLEHLALAQLNLAAAKLKVSETKRGVLEAELAEVKKQKAEVEAEVARLRIAQAIPNVAPDFVGAAYLIEGPK